MSGYNGSDLMQHEVAFGERDLSLILRFRLFCSASVSVEGLASAAESGAHVFKEVVVFGLTEISF